LISTEKIQALQQGKLLKNPGIEESWGTQQEQMKERLKKKYTRRLRIILESV